MQLGRGGPRPPTGITFDSDLGNNIDSLLTLAFLRAMSAKNETRVISVSITKANLKAAQAEEAITNFYAAVTAPGFGAANDKVGLADNGKMAADTPALNAIVSKKGADGKPAYLNQIESVVDTADGAITMRNNLLAQDDENAVILLDGPATNIARLMELYGARPQITAKVKYLVAAVGSFPNGAADSSLKSDIAAARKMFAEWPTEIIAVGAEVGDAIPYPGASIEKDFSWTQAHPVVDAYRAFKPMPYDAPASGMAAALYGVHPNDGYFKVSEPGTITVLDDGRAKFTPGQGGRHRYLIADPAQKEKITAMYTELISAKPMPRVNARGRGGRGFSGLAGGRGASGGGRGVLPPLPAK